jgi:hypothetical protein
MGRFLQGWAIATIVVLAAVMLSGFIAPTAVSDDVHVLAGYVGTVAALFSHTISMFYFIGTGAAVKGAAKEQAGRGNSSLVPLWEQTKSFKNTLFPVQMMSMLALMAASIVGAGALTGALPSWLHLALELGAVPLNVYALARTVGIIERNITLMNVANELLARAGE